MKRIFITALFFVVSTVAAWARNEDPISNGINNVINRDLVSDVQDSMQENRFLKRVYPLIFRSSGRDSDVPELDSDFSEWEGKQIIYLNIIQQDVFEISARSEKIPLYNDVLRFANMVQPKTRMNILKSNLFVSEGDSLNPDLLVANLQYLYDLGLFSELTFFLSDRGDNATGIDLVVREKFFLLLSSKLMDSNKLQLKLLDRNFLGLGHSMKHSWYIDPKKRESLGWESTYTYPNMFSRFIQGDLNYLTLPGQKSFSLAFQRDFLYPLYADFGGVDFCSAQSSPPHDSIRVKKQEYGAWYAHAFSNLEYPQYLYSAISMESTKHQEHPDGLSWQDSFFALGALGYASSEYRNIQGLGSFLDSDYLPKGHLLQLLYGYEFGKMKQRPFLGIHSAFSAYRRPGHYLYAKMAWDSFFDGAEAEQSFIAIEPLYISPPKIIGNLEARSLIRSRIVKSYKTLPIQTITLSEDIFFREGEDLQGTDLLSVSIEEDFNTSYRVLGFQISYFAYIDMAVMDGCPGSKNREHLYEQGLGLRFRNPSLIWDFIEFRGGLKYINADKPSFNVSLSLKPTRILEDFRGKRPKPYMH
ncbi:MAG: hypothetical protein PHQ78_08690 [Candidatus Cloacimonetes bacterium]|nr:hypothetical protein [Candidatus Cloacimonadota bacterium]MDD4560681.1 hypothetical protein [Candidatus Cloacimonadota bacterium]